MTRLFRTSLLATRRLTTRSSSNLSGSDTQAAPPGGPTFLGGGTRTTQRCGSTTILMIMIIGMILYVYKQHRDSARHNNTKTFAGYIENEPTWKSTTATATTTNNNNNGSNGIRTERDGCLEYSNGGQTCVYSGIMCVLVNKDQAEYVTQPHVFFVDDSHKNYIPVSNDKWCDNRIGNGPTEWPPKNEYFAPRHSCMYARWRTYSSLIANMLRPVKVKWIESLSFIPLDYQDHNNSLNFVMNNLWLLDTKLWQKSLEFSKTRRNMTKLFPKSTHILLANSKSQFSNLNDLSHFLFALLLQLDVKHLYHKQSIDEDKHLWTKSFFDSFPSLSQNILFYQDEMIHSKNDLICTRRLTVGPKSNSLGHPRVCEYLRTSGWDLLDIKQSENIDGTNGEIIKFSKPPRKVVLLQRHGQGSIRNLDELSESLKQAATKFGFEFELHSTETLKTAVEYIRLFSNVGVLLTPHGDHEIGTIWMPRHSAVIEIFPPGFADLTYQRLSESCKLWYFDMVTKVPVDKRTVYKEKCRNKGGYVFDTCKIMRHESIDVDVENTVDLVLAALRRIGHNVNIVQ